MNIERDQQKTAMLGERYGVSPAGLTFDKLKEIQEAMKHGAPERLRIGNVVHEMTPKTRTRGQFAAWLHSCLCAYNQHKQIFNTTRKAATREWVLLRRAQKAAGHA
jgi:hypothetical protein